MPSEAPLLPTQTEKPHHYTYLKEFRTQQCPLFLQHKCTQHRPFTCFHWHFMNQRRRRPIRRREGTFNYNPDQYCTKYDETTGICKDGDECPFLHRTAGDTERRYHLRYYKTSVCVHETDAKGHCTKNGPHCAFAHGVRDLRPPVHDVRELQAMEVGEIGGEHSIAESPLGSSVEKDRQINEDPKWNDTNYVLANYKTEQCKRPPRLCRQGYACPSFHNFRDKRRSPKKFKYRSTPCPNVKHGDDWGDPSQCENQDGCPYCHTRTEQQFHPEIYKSSKCNDMVQHGYCPRGPFCAFAHVEQEMTTQRELAAASENSLAAFLTNVLPDSRSDQNDDNEHKDDEPNNTNGNDILDHQSNGGGLLMGMGLASSLMGASLSSSFPEPIGKGRANSFSGSVASDSGFGGFGMAKAPGSEREEAHVHLRQQIQAIDGDASLDAAEKSKRKQNLLLLHNLNISSGGNGAGQLSPSYMNNMAGAFATTMSPNAPSFYPPGDTVESVIGNALEEDLNLGELSLSSIDREMARGGDNDNDTNSVCSSLSTGVPASQANQAYLGATSVPVTIPSVSGGGSSEHRSTLSSSISQSVSPATSPANNFLRLSQQQKQEQQLHGAAAAFLSQPNPGKFSAPGYTGGDYNSLSSPRGSISQSPLLGPGPPPPGSSAPPGVAGPPPGVTGCGAGAGGAPGAGFGMNGYGEMQRLRDELAANKAKLQQWEEGILQARGFRLQACEAWKKEAEECKKKAKQVEDERVQAYKQRDEALNKVAQLSKELEAARNNPFLHSLKRGSELEVLPLPLLQKLKAQLIVDLDMLDQLVYKQEAMTCMKCMVCVEKQRCVAVMPCNHYVMCERCAARRADCPYCHQPISQRSSLVLPAAANQQPPPQAAPTL